MTPLYPRFFTQPAAGRACGSCTLCCKVIGVGALNKAAGSWCRHCEIGRGCSVYDGRPQECREFLCVWLADARLGEEWKPDRSKLVVTTADEGRTVEIRCDPGFPQAWRQEPYHGQILEWAAVARTYDGMVIVSVGKRVTLVAVEGEFPLGIVEPEDRIAREISGHRLLGVRVVRNAG
jgi:hypothetical protein